MSGNKQAEPQTFAADPVEVLSLVRRGLSVAQRTNDAELEAAARSVLSRLVFHLTSKFVVFPTSMRSDYELLKRQ